MAARVLAFPHDRLRWRRTAVAMWPAWRALGRWEETTAAELGLPFGELLVVLWALHRLGGTDVGLGIADDLFHDLPTGSRCDPLLEDVAECAFALGAGWAESRRAAEH